MAGAVDKKKNDVKDALISAPKTFVDARSSILADITLSREFAANFLDALCKPLAGKNEDGENANMSLNTVCRILEKQKRLCYGAREIATDFARAFILPDHSVINGTLGLTEPSTSAFGIKATDIGETYPITLSNTEGATQTQDSNTFSTWVGDYYLVRSRVSGELIDIADDVTPYSTPDTETVFGNAVVWVAGTATEPGGGAIATEQEANTWNYNYATANIASVTTTGSGATELTVLTLSSALTPGSNSANYTPLGPAFAQKFYLKRKADLVNTITITGTTTINSVSITEVSEADLAKVKYGDVISGQGIPDANVTIVAVQTEKNAIRLSESGTATETGTVTLTVNSVPFGYAAHDIFCQVEIVAEGLVVNDNWKPVGDDDGLYNAANEGPDPRRDDTPPEGNEDELLVATTTEFKNLLQFFNPSSPNNDLTKGASASLVSDGKEYNGTSYPDIETNPMFPANLGTTATRAIKPDPGGEFTGTQPDGLGNKDVWVGRFVAWNKDRMNADAQKVGEYRYILDNAERFFYAPSRNATYTGGSVTIAADPNNPATRLAQTPPVTNESEPRAVLPRDGLTNVVWYVNNTATIQIPNGTGYTGLVMNISSTFIPVDQDTTHSSITTSSGTSAVSGGYAWQTSPPSETTIAKFYTVEDGWIMENQLYLGDLLYHGDQTSHSHTTLTSTCTWNATIKIRKSTYNCKANFYKQFLAANPDVVFLKETVDALQGSVKFRDPNITETTVVSDDGQGGGREIPAGTGSTSLGISDKAFDDYISVASGTSSSEWEKSIDDMEARLGEVRTELQRQVNLGSSAGGRIGITNGGNNLGTEIGEADPSTAANPNMTLGFGWFTSNNATLLVNCNKRVQEVDARIGKPKYNGSEASRGTPPGYYVEKIPSSNTTSGLIPYGRSIYNNVNYLLGQDVELLGKITKDIESLDDLIDLVKSDRNKYEIFSGRDKVY